MTLFLKNLETGETFPFDGITTVELITDSGSSSDFIPFSPVNEFRGVICELRPLSRKAMHKIFGLEKWQITMLKHQRKKNRGLKRRLRRARMK